MIKNIIFDMGQVLISFDPDVFLTRIGVVDEEDRKILKREVYKSVEWAKMDRGTLTEEEACKIMETRVPDRLKSCVSKLTCEWDRPIIPIVGAKELIKELKDNGYKIYLLSNASYKQKEYWPQIPGSEYFDGEIVSAYEKLVKPQPEIYKILLDRFKLNAEECAFIDDSITNVESAMNLNINGIVFHGDYQEVRKKLISLGVEVSE